MTTTVENQTEAELQQWLCAQSFEAELTWEQIQAIDKTVVEEQPIAARNFRAALAVLSRSSAYMLANSTDDPEASAEALLDALEAVVSSIDQHKREVEIMESAVARMHIVIAQVVELDSAGM